MKKFLTAVLAICLLLSLAVFTVSAKEAEFEDSFDDYEPGLDATGTEFAKFFNIGVPQVGDSFMNIEANDDSTNLYLRLSVFTEFVIKTPLKTAYTYSVKLLYTEGDYRTGIFYRAPFNGTGLYEQANQSGDDSIITGQTGVSAGIAQGKFYVDVRTYDRSAEIAVKHNYFEFDLPEGSELGDLSSEGGITIKAVDDFETMKFYVDDTLMCTLEMSDPGKKYVAFNITDICFAKIEVKDASGQSLGVLTNTLVEANQSRIGIGTRVANMRVDNIYVSYEKEEASTNEETTVAEQTTTKETTVEEATIFEDTSTSESATVEETVSEERSTTENISTAESETNDSTNSSGCKSVIGLEVVSAVAVLGLGFNIILRRKH